MGIEDEKKGYEKLFEFRRILIKECRRHRGVTTRVIPFRNDDVPRYLDNLDRYDAWVASLPDDRRRYAKERKAA